MEKYVNMADVITFDPDELQDQFLNTELIELLFFAYRDFVSEPDEVLAAYGFGRAHHRVLHFVGRNPGICVADLLEILKITKQSLARVLRQLVETGFVRQKTGANDRRQRLLFLTQDGQELARSLTAVQSKRIAAALAGLPPEQVEAVRGFLINMINEDERPLAVTLTRR